jgi:hypothetical protein
MVDRRWQIREEPLQRDRIVGVEGGCALGAEVEPGLLQAFGIAARDHDLGALGPGASCRLQTDTCASADHDDRLPKQFRFPKHGHRGGRGHQFSLDIAVSA